MERKPRLPSLDRAKIVSNVKSEWAGPSHDRMLVNGMIERARPFSAILVGDGDPGDRISEIRVLNEKTQLGATQFRWEVAAAIKAVPSASVAQFGEW